MSSNKTSVFALHQALLLLICVLLLSGCSKYSGNWECGKIKGIGCSSIEYAEKVAKEQILLNTQPLNKKIEIKEHYEGFKKVPTKVIEVR